MFSVNIIILAVVGVWWLEKFW